VRLHRFLAAFLLLGFLFHPWSIGHAQTEPPVVRAVLFYSPTCGHCEYVITNVLRPMTDQYGDRLQIMAIDVTQQQGQALFITAMQKYGFESAGVPFLVIGETVLIGSVDIPDKFPDLVKTYLAKEGVDWPDIPRLMETISTASSTPEITADPTVIAARTETLAGNASTQTGALQTAPTSATVSPASPSTTATPGIAGITTKRNNWQTKFLQDPGANTFSVLVLLGMLGSMFWAVLILRNTKGASIKEGWAWIIPLLCLIGMIVAGYLAYVETRHVEAVCGPVGDCNTVQQSEYARLFGILPIGVLGLIGYAAMLAAWLVARYAGDQVADLTILSMFVMTVLGTFFSIYLTFLEPFVIGASCAWCLTSAILMTLLMLLTARLATASYARVCRAQSKRVSGSIS
jgi:uncharacterized membrane protein